MLITVFSPKQEENDQFQIDCRILAFRRASRWIPGYCRRPRRGLARRAADARTARAGGAYDGTWNVVFATTRGNCSSGYSVPFPVTGSRVIVGRRRPGLRLDQPLAAALPSRSRSALPRPTAAAGSAGNSGAGPWSGVISGDHCSGTWQATRS